MASKQEPMNPSDDRRKFPRFKTKVFLGIPVRLDPLPPFFGTSLQGQLLDLSAGGMSIYIGERIPNDTQLHLQLIFPDRSILKANTRICRSVPQKGRYVIGIEFLDLPDFLQTKIERMASDYLACEARIKERAKEICRMECAFFNLCDKKEKLEATHLLDLKFQMKLKLKSE